MTILKRNKNGREYCSVRLVTFTQLCDVLIETCAKVSKKSELCTNDKDRRKFLTKLIDWGHTSVFEHACATFYIENISRACSHQLVRHRIASFTQESQRDVKPNGLIIPPSIKDSKVVNISDIIKNIDAPLEDKRYFYPNATKTSLFMTINFRSLMNFFKLRLGKKAQWEIKAVACCVYELITEHTDAFANLDPDYVAAMNDLAANYNLKLISPEDGLVKCVSI